MRILVFAPHPDDEVLGCGGTIARYVAERNDVYVCIITSAMPPIYNDELAIQNHWPHVIYPEIIKSHAALGVKDTLFLQMPAVMLDTIPRYQLNSKVAEVVNRIEPDVVYIPHFGDIHTDHALTANAVLVAMRPKRSHIVRYVYAYETLSETEWSVAHARNSFLPNVYIDISAYLSTKMNAMMCYTSQLEEFPSARSLEAVASLSKTRGSTMGAKAAEAFMLIREYRIDSTKQS